MLFRKSFVLFFSIVPLILGCGGSLKEVITSTPAGARFYWGKAEADFRSYIRMLNQENPTNKEKEKDFAEWLVVEKAAKKKKARNGKSV